MKIRNVDRPDYGAANIRGPEAHEDPLGREVNFRQTLTTLSKDQHEARLNVLIGDIDAQAEKLSKRVDIKEFEKYRTLIREFLDEVVSNGYSFSKENAFGARGRHRFFATVRTVDEKLDAMAKAVISDQAESIDLLGSMDEIRGLILDLML